MKFRHLLIPAAVALCSTAPLQGAVVVSTLSNPSSAVFAVGVVGQNTIKLEQGFKPGSTYRLVDALVNVSGSAAAASPAAASLFDNNGGIPGNLLTTFAFPTPPASQSTVTLTPASNLIDLLAGSTYWLVLEGAQPSYAWYATQSGLGNFAVTGDGALAGNGFMLNAGAWNLFGTPQPFLFQINGTQVPEVSTYAAAAFAFAAVAWQGIRRAKSSR